MARAFTHPGTDDITLDGLLHALADPDRRAIVSCLMGGKALSCSTTCGRLPPSTISFHYKVLREAGLVRSEKKGVEVLNTLRFDDVDGKFPGLLAAILNSAKP